MKKLFALVLCIALVLTMLAGCGVKTKGTDTGTEHEKVPITLLSLSSLETETNVVRDQLTKAGFDVTLSIQPDYGSLFTQVDARNYDIYLCTMKVLSGNPDYGCRSMFYSTGIDNDSKVVDAEVDRLIDLGASQLPQDYEETYAQLERYVVEEKAYFAPICRTMSSYGFNKNIVDASTITVGQSKYLYWSQIDYVDESLRDTRPLVVCNDRVFGQFDPLTCDGTHRVLANTNIKMLELDDNDNIVTNRALAYNYSIGEGNSTFYFVLRDNVGFYTAINGELVDTGEKVGAEDVIFTYNRLRNPDAVPGHQVYDNYACISDVASVTDLSELENTVDAETGKTVKEILEAGLPAPISELVSSKNATNNAAGKYEVVKVTTSTPFPQILNFLCDYCSGIVSKKQVESINTPELLANYDPTKDTRYGDAQYLMEGSGKQNTLWCSGPYVIKSMNDYEAVCERNPAFMPGTEMAPVIKNITLKYIADKDASISALRSGEIDVTDNVPANQVQVVESDANLGLVSSLINGCIQMKFNLDEDHITNNEDIRKAILYSINQDEVVAVKNGLGGKCYTAMTMLKNDNDLIPDPNKVKEHLDNYFASLG
ncbi:MAG: hypothetical protein J6J90_02215 [Angelakisella sp.]|nr:hypothetical protein [Angelakisella sp.]